MLIENAKVESDEKAGAQRVLPRQLRDYRDFHKDETILVCGCGSSLAQIAPLESFITIGVNDVGRLFHPDYLVVLNPRSQFSGDRFKYVENSQASAIFTQLNLGISHPNIVRFRLGRRSGVDLSDLDSLPYTRNSPYVALCLAIHMGARRIGVIGVDFTNDHFFARTGQHPLARELPQIDREYKQLYEACVARGVEVFNLSEQSRLTALPKISLKEFAALQKRKAALEIVSYAVTPVAGVPAILSRCISVRTPHSCRTVWATNSYGNGVIFEGDVEWRRAPSQAEELLNAADLVIVHNGKVSPRHQVLLAHKPVITMAHNYMWNVAQDYVQQGFPGAVVGQYQATLSEFRGWDVVPNPVPLWESSFQPGLKNSEITICYTPSGKHEKYPPEHRLYWHSKGYATTMRALENLARRFPVRLEVIPGGQISHAESLSMKRRSHIVIDECVTGSYHRNSLEGLAAGCVVINGLGRLPSVAEVFHNCSASDCIPFTYATLENLEKVLEEMIGRGTNALIEEGVRNRAWMEEHWDFEKQWARFWEPVIDKAFHRARGLTVTRAARAQADSYSERKNGIASQEIKSSLSVVVCQGGQERLRQLAASLASLRQCPEINEIIVVDMGSAPFAKDLSRRWADKYVFVRNDETFERARSLNIGSALAEHELIMWFDNDLIPPPEFIAKAVAEMHRRQLDYLIPYTHIKYLSENDSRSVMMGTRNPADCSVAGVLTVLRGASGGAGIIKKSFFQANGGMLEAFRGWGGEDDAWWHKARLLGNAAATGQRGQFLYHLFHQNSRSYTKQKQSNPHYSRNVAILREVWSIHDRQAFLKRFPPQAHVSWGWKDKCVAFISRAAGFDSSTVLEHLIELASVEIHSRILPGNEPVSAALVTQKPPDAVVIFGMELAMLWLADDERSVLWPKTIVIHDGSRISTDTVQQLRRAGAVLCMSSVDAVVFKEAGLQPWIHSAPPETSSTPLNTALTLLQPLSIILGAASVSAGVAERVSETGVSVLSEAGHRPTLPVWMYWEGDCPEWIKQCHQTVLTHAPDVRILSPDDFQKMRDRDQDIDLSRLLVAHRADYIRAFLLAKYGGLWIDSDCIVMKSLPFILEMLDQYDFIAHRERSGLVSNGFIGSRIGGKIAAEYYRRICSVIRSGKTLGWTSLGSEPLTAILKTTTSPWFEIHCERIQPVCWSHPDAFFEPRSPAEHERVFDDQAICYMLSNVQVKKFQSGGPSRDLLGEPTFFNYAIKKAMRNGSGQDRQYIEQPRPEVDQFNAFGVARPMEEMFTRIAAQNRKVKNESISGPGSTLVHTEEIRQRLPLLVQDLGVRSILDAGCGDFNWLKHVRFGIDQYIGADVASSLVAENKEKFSAPGREFVCMDIAGHPLPQVELILCRDFLVLLSYEDIFRVLANFKRSGSRYLLTTTFENRQANSDIATGEWRPLNLRYAPFNFPEPLRIMNEKCKEAGGTYSDKSLALWKIEDISLSAAVSTITPEAVSVLPDKPPLPPEVIPDKTVPYELAVIVPISVVRGQQDRLRNLKACLKALSSQDLERKRYRVIVVEQDTEPHLESIVAPLVDQYIFAYNSGPFNKGWAFNIGVSAASAKSALCLIDADILPSPKFLSAGLNCIQSGQRAMRPYAQVTYLDPSSTEQAIRDTVADCTDGFSSDKYRGQSFKGSRGGCIWIEPQLYRQICGFDERFMGFGCEDTEFWDRISTHTEIKIGTGTLLHMHHPRTVDRNCSVANGRLYDQISSGRVAAWAGPMGNIDRYSGKCTNVNSGLVENKIQPKKIYTNGHNGSGHQTMVEVFANMVSQCSRVGLESLSGPGSTLAQTAEIRQRLPVIIRDVGARSFLDAPCGDFNWMRHVDLGVEKYVGIDLLPALVKRNQNSFGSQGGRTFLNLNLTNDPLPEMDMILCRDCLVHLSYEDIFLVLKNFKASKSKYLLTTTFEKHTANADTSGGLWRPLNLRLAPFNLPEPLIVINEKCTEERGRYRDKSLALWQLADIP